MILQQYWNHIIKGNMEWKAHLNILPNTLHTTTGTWSLLFVELPIQLYFIALASAQKWLPLFCVGCLKYCIITFKVRVEFFKD